MSRTIGTLRCPFLYTDYSLPASSCPPRGLFFLPCNDVISLDFRLFIHDSIIVEDDIKSKYAEEYSTVDKEGSQKFLAIQGNPVSCGVNRLLTSYLYVLDLIITRSGETSALNLSGYDPVISDHFAVHCSLTIKKPPNAKLTVMTRKLCNIVLDSLCTDIRSYSL